MPSNDGAPTPQGSKGTQTPGLQPHELWFGWLGRCWEALLDFCAVLFPFRFSLLVLILGTGLLLFVEQSQDALYVIVADAVDGGWMGWLRLAIFVTGTVFWAFSSFYAARLMSRLPPRGREQLIRAADQSRAGSGYLYPPPVVHERWIKAFNLWLPRWLGYLVIICVTLSVMRASWRLDTAVVVSVGAVGVAILVAFQWFIIHRHAVVDATRTRTSWRGLAATTVVERDLTAEVVLPVHWRVLLGLVSLAVLLVCLASAFWELRPGWVTIHVATLACVTVGLAALYATPGFPRETKQMVTIQVVVIAALFLFSVTPYLPPFANSLGAPAIVVLAAAGWAFAGTFFFALPAHVTRLPVLPFLIILSLVFSVVGTRDNHAIRNLAATPVSLSVAAMTASPHQGFTTPDDTACAPLLPGPNADKQAVTDPKAMAETAKRAAFAAAFARWCKVAGKHHLGNAAIPLVIVATAGGASRAAYWTEKVLGELEARVPHFHNHVFAISSVSGGTLGAAAYRLSLDLPRVDTLPAKPFSGAACDANDKGSGPTNCILAMLQRDFLGSLLMGGLYADLAQRFLPGALLPDRATALEASWEYTWSSYFPDTGKGWMADGFRGRANAFLTQPDTWRPIMLFNGTSMLGGQRVITSNLPVSGRFANAIDFYDMLPPDRDIPFSTAIHNSARFPFLDAAGSIMQDGQVTDRLVDGGYFENFGAATALDVLEQLIDGGVVAAAGTEAMGGRPGRRVAPIIVQISNDAEVAPKRPLGTPVSISGESLPFKFVVAADITTPLIVFFDTRDGLGQRATDVLRNRLAYLAADGGNDQRYFHFQIGDRRVPMSWLLSDYAGGLIDAQLPLAAAKSPCDPDKANTRPACNLQAFADLLRLFETPVPKSPSASAPASPSTLNSGANAGQEQSQGASQDPR